MGTCFLSSSVSILMLAWSFISLSLWPTDWNQGRWQKIAAASTFRQPEASRHPPAGVMAHQPSLISFKRQMGHKMTEKIWLTRAGVRKKKVKKKEKSLWLIVFLRKHCLINRFLTFFFDFLFLPALSFRHASKLAVIRLDGSLMKPTDAWRKGPESYRFSWCLQAHDDEEKRFQGPINFLSLSSFNKCWHHKGLQPCQLEWKKAGN